ncbi:hypothetical protein FAP48_18770 [Morganella morganii]|nr:hypothetical protein [Morganella morganii]
MVDYSVFREYLKSLDDRNQRLNLRRLCLHSDLLENRSKNSGLDFRYLMQADFILFLRRDIHSNDFYSRWYPYTLLYVGSFPGAFEVFARASSKSFFEKMKIMLGINKKSDLDALMENYKNNSITVPSWEFNSFNPSTLAGFEQLYTKE